MLKLNVKAFALAGGIFWGIGLSFIPLWVMLFEGATGERMLLGKLYPGWSISPQGSLIGLLWGLADGMIAGAFFAWLYNTISEKVS